MNRLKKHLILIILLTFIQQVAFADVKISGTDVSGFLIITACQVLGILFLFIGSMAYYGYEKKWPVLVFSSSVITVIGFGIQLFLTVSFDYSEDKLFNILLYLAILLVAICMPIVISRKKKTN